MKKNMSTSNNQFNIKVTPGNIENSLIDNTEVFSESTRKDIEKSYNLDAFKETEAYFSSRYGWILRRKVD